MTEAIQPSLRLQILKGFGEFALGEFPRLQVRACLYLGHFGVCVFALLYLVHFGARDFFLYLVQFRVSECEFPHV